MKKLLGCLMFVAALAAFNTHLILGGGSGFTFEPHRVLAGEIWRLFTYAWVHISFYHLALDGTATALLFMTARGSLWKKAAWFQICSLCSVLMTWIAEPRIHELGLAGLSGAAHGLWVITCVQGFRSDSKAERILSWAAAVGITFKAAFETLTGSALFGSMHLGNVGIPIAACHLGGILAGWALGLMNGGISALRVSRCNASLSVS